MTEPISFAEGSMGQFDCVLRALKAGVAAVVPTELLKYGDPRGTQALRKLLAAMHSSPRLRLTEDNARVTSSAQQSLCISLRFLRDLLGGAGTVFLQEPAYFGAVRLLAKERNWSVEAFTDATDLVPRLRSHPASLPCVVYLTSNFQTPSGDSLSEAGKDALAAAVRALEKGWVIEDNPYDLLHLDGDAAPSTLLERLADCGRVLFVGSLSKLLGPGLRIGYLLSSERTVAHKLLHAAKIDADLFTSTAGQQLAAGALSTAFLADLRRELQKRRRAALASLERHLGGMRAAGEVRWRVPGGGIFINVVFTRLDGRATELLQDVSRSQHSLVLEPSKFMYRERRTRAETRVNFAELPPHVFDEGVRRLAVAIRSVADRCPPAKRPRVHRRTLRVLITSGLRDGTPAPAQPAGILSAIADELRRDHHEVTIVRGCGGAQLGGKECASADEYTQSVAAELAASPDVAILEAESSGTPAQPQPELAGAKQKCPTAFLVGFQRAGDVGSVPQLVDAAYGAGIRARCNLSVATGSVGSAQATILITPEKGTLPCSRSALPQALSHALQTRVSSRHYRTTVEQSAEHLSRPQTAELRQVVSKGFKLQLFSRYLAQQGGQHFGFVAVRIPDGEGFLITARGGDKERLPDSDIVHVAAVDEQGLLVKVRSSTGKKASLNAPVAARIFATRPEVSVILHAHVFPGCDNCCEVDYSPGTQEDVDEVCRYLSKSEPIMEIPDHGVVAVGSSGEECIRAIGRSHAYHRFAPLYDTIYHRFLQSMDFIDLITARVRTSEKILDCAAGTGEVSAELVRRGFSNVSLADASGDMLQVAAAKLRPRIRTLDSWTTTFQELDVGGAKFDAIVIRQAINYAMDVPGLKRTMVSLRKALRPGGRLLFNTTNFNPDASNDYPAKLHRSTLNGVEVEVSEGNYLSGRELWHAQRCVLYSADGAVEIKQVFDCNVFGMFTAEEMESAAASAGFSRVELLGKGLVPLTPASRSVYVVAHA